MTTSISPDTPIYSSQVAAEATGATLRQLQWWDEQELLKPARYTGAVRSRRLYSRNELIQACIALELRDKGIPLKAAMRAAAPRDGVWDKRYLVVAGESFQLLGLHQVMEWICNSNVPVVVVEVGKHIERLKNGVLAQ